MPLSGKDLVRLMKADGWILVRINGSHHIMGKDTDTLSIPVHGNKSLGKGLEKELLKKAGIKKKQ